MIITIRLLWLNTPGAMFCYGLTYALTINCPGAVFSDCWQALLNDVTNLAKEVSELLQDRATEKHVYMSLPRPGVRMFYTVWKLITFSYNIYIEPAIKALL